MLLPEQSTLTSKPSNSNLKARFPTIVLLLTCAVPVCCRLPLCFAYWVFVDDKTNAHLQSWVLLRSSGAVLQKELVFLNALDTSKAQEQLEISDILDNILHQGIGKK